MSWTVQPRPYRPADHFVEKEQFASPPMALALSGFLSVAWAQRSRVEAERRLQAEAARRLPKLTSRLPGGPRRPLLSDPTGTSPRRQPARSRAKTTPPIL